MAQKRSGLVDTIEVPIVVRGHRVRFNDVATPTRMRWQPRARIFPTIAREGALLATAHEPFPPWGRIVDAGDGYRWQRC